MQVSGRDVTTGDLGKFLWRKTGLFAVECVRLLSFTVDTLTVETMSGDVIEAKPDDLIRSWGRIGARKLKVRRYLATRNAA